MKKLTSLVLCVILLLPFFAFASAAEDFSISITFSNDLRGSAAGIYTFSAPEAGTFDLFWADETGAKLTSKIGERQLSYTALTSFTVKKAGEVSFSPQVFTAIPYGAKKAIAVNKDGATVASFDLPAEKLQEKEQNYAYGVLSDLHFEHSDDGSNQANAPVSNAFSFFESVGVKYAFGSGDIATNADKESYQDFNTVLKNTTVQFLTCGGNHEVVSGFDRMYGEGGLFYQYFNKGVYDGTLEGVVELAPNGYDFIYQIPGTNDLFMIVSQVRWDSRAPSQKPLVEPETITWMGDMCVKYKDMKMHLMMHTFLSDDDYTHVDGEGDISNKAGYGYGYYWNIYSEEDARLRAMFDEYENLIWFNGHSHWIYEMQKYNENLNIYDYEGTASTMVHVPSVTAPRTVSDTETSYHSNIGVRSEGVLMLSCDGYEVENGINFKTGEIYAYGCYIIYQKDAKTVSGQAGESLTWTFDRQCSSLRVTGSGEMTSVSGADAQPWASYKDAVKSVYIGKNVGSVGDNCFAGLTAAAKIEIKEGTAKIGKNAFAGCVNVTSLSLPESLTEISDGAFENLGDTPYQSTGAPTPTVWYAGTPERYAKISVGEGNDALARSARTCNKRVVTWKVGTYVRTEEVALGGIPSYGDAVASPIPGSDKYLPFTGWNNGKTTYKPAKELPAVSGNITYTAVFGAESDRTVGGTTTSSTVEWSLDRYNGVLTISGKKDMADLSSYEDQPWRAYKDEIYTVVVKKSVRKIGKNSFAHLPNLKTIVFEDKVVTLGTDCFAYNDALTDVYLPSTIQSVNQGACYQSNNITNIYFDGDADQWAGVCARVTSFYNESVFDSNNVSYGVTAPTAEKFTVTFVTPEGEVIAEKKASWKGGVIPPAAPAREETFIGWDSTYFLVDGDMTVTAVYAEMTPLEKSLYSLPFDPGALVVASLSVKDAA